MFIEFCCIMLLLQMYLLVWCYYVPHLLDCSEFSLAHRFHGRFIIVFARAKSLFH